MADTPTFLVSPQARARWMRLDTAQLLKRFFFCERSLLLSHATWIPRIGSLEMKTYTLSLHDAPANRKSVV